jgi:hypothetical protein
MFVMTPEGGPMRVFRYRDASAFWHEDIIAFLDPTTNTLTINRELYERLPQVERHMLLRTTATVVERRRAA